MDNNLKKKLVLGILAHVDAGKTTLAEGILYINGKIRSLGRVDHKNAFLDNFQLERDRGITIFSKQAQIELNNLDVTLLDTPGHVDFSAEMERTLQVLDYAVLLVSGADGVSGHVKTLWRLLDRYDIPVFIFVNKMDQEGTDSGRLLEELQGKLDFRCVAFGPGMEGDSRTEFLESVAMCDESLMEEYLEGSEISDESISAAIAERKIFPVYFGSALRLWGVEELLHGIEEMTLVPEYPKEFGARVFKIARDNNGMRLTYMKITGGCLRVKMPVSNFMSSRSEDDSWEEKVDQIRIYEGGQYKAADRVEAGGICAVTGLSRTFAGQGIGFEKDNETPILQSVLTYQLIPPVGADPARVLGCLRQLEEEDPLLHIVWKESLAQIHVQVMGDVQIEVLKHILLERFGLEVTFGEGNIVYKETVSSPTVGIGHFEPLRHYAEVHLLVEPGERGSGVMFASACSEDLLDKNWQRLIETHVEEKVHTGVLTGSELTDVRIVLLTGKAHKKHTEGGDFRQATYRAIRNALMKGENQILEPYMEFTLEVPTGMLGRAMTDIKNLSGTFDAPVTDGEESVLYGRGPVATMRDYQRSVTAYTKGLGRFSCNVYGYELCHNQEEVRASIGYDPDGDIENPSGSVFCSHGAGFIVEWNQVENYAHLENGWQGSNGDNRGDKFVGTPKDSGNGTEGIKLSAKEPAERYISQEEIDEIFSRTFGKRTEDKKHYRRYHVTNSGQKNVDFSIGKNRKRSEGEYAPAEEYLLVDGYNIIFAWEELKELAKVNIDSARDRLIDIMCDYQGCIGGTLILVFDAYKVKGNMGSHSKYNNIYVVYTKEAETADQYIEKTVHEIGRKYRVTVATSDALEQMIIWGEGASRISAGGFREAVERAKTNLRENYKITTTD